MKIRRDKAIALSKI